MKQFSSAQTVEFRERLAQRRAELISEIEARLADAKDERIAPDAAEMTDGGDKALLETASGLDLAIVKHDADELRAIESAQARLAEGAFGVCTDCGGAIVLERLRAYPAAMRCASCQNEFERTRGGTRARRP